MTHCIFAKLLENLSMELTIQAFTITPKRMQRLLMVAQSVLSPKVDSLKVSDAPFLPDMWNEFYTYHVAADAIVNMIEIPWTLHLFCLRYVP